MKNKFSGSRWWSKDLELTSSHANIKLQLQNNYLREEPKGQLSYNKTHSEKATLRPVGKGDMFNLRLTPLAHWPTNESNIRNAEVHHKEQGSQSPYWAPSLCRPKPGRQSPIRSGFENQWDSAQGSWRAIRNWNCVLKGQMHKLTSR